MKFLNIAALQELLQIKKESTSYTSWFRSQRKFWVKSKMTSLFDDFLTLKPNPVSHYCRLLPKFEQEFDSM